MSDRKDPWWYDAYVSVIKWGVVFIFVWATGFDWDASTPFEKLAVALLVLVWFK